MSESINLNEIEKELRILESQQTNTLHRIRELLEAIHKAKHTEEVNEDINKRYNGSYAMKDILLRYRLFDEEYLNSKNGLKFLANANAKAKALSGEQTEEIIRNVATTKQKSDIKNLEGYIIKSLENAVNELKS